MTMRFKINPFRKANPMTWKDAVCVSAVLTMASFFITFLLPYTWISMTSSFESFCFEAVRFIGATFFANFIALTGLAQFVGKKNETEKNKEKGT